MGTDMWHWQVAWMRTESWHGWTLTGGAAGATLIISALMRHFPCYMLSL
ncbi:unnamed protein product [Staurois parvus]|uniref:Uncharacterized protein n=1 Tax=Staurois parvus TaxID=386267 RepID=A0ABN9CLC8_9NEOB|nr:unnamed protein product [Staurois parvus]